LRNGPPHQQGDENQTGAQKGYGGFGHGDGVLCFFAETLWLRPSLREQAGGAARLIEKGVVCWLHLNRGLLLVKPIRMFGERR
jgi:hypothetical protein